MSRNRELDRILRVAIAVSSDVYRRAVVDVLTSQQQIQLVGAASSVAELLVLISGKTAVDVVVVELGISASGLPALVAQIHETLSSCRVIGLVPVMTSRYTSSVPLSGVALVEHGDARALLAQVMQVAG